MHADNANIRKTTDGIGRRVDALVKTIGGVQNAMNSASSNIDTMRALLDETKNYIVQNGGPGGYVLKLSPSPSFSQPLAMPIRIAKAT